MMYLRMDVIYIKHCFVFEPAKISNQDYKHLSLHQGEGRSVHHKAMDEYGLELDTGIYQTQPCANSIQQVSSFFEAL